MKKKVEKDAKPKAPKKPAPVADPGLEPVESATKDEVLAASKMQPEEARLLVDTYYTMQRGRIRAGNQIGAVQREVDEQAELPTLAYARENFGKVEKQLVRALKVYAESSVAGRWLLGVRGIGPVLAAGLLAHVDPAQCTTAGKLWRFAGLDPTTKWERGKKRPYNAALKVLCWKIGESFKRLGGDDGSLYAKLYRDRKVFEVANNESGKLADQALARLERATKEKWRISPEQRETWASGKLQAVGLDLRATRYAVKIFLSHFQAVAFELHFHEKAPRPWIIQYGGHADEIAIPNWPMKE